MKKPIRWISLFAVAIATVFSFAACDGAFGFDDYSFENKQPDEYIWRDYDLEPGDGMTVDGNLDEAVWNTTEAATFRDVDDECSMIAKVVLGDTGAFFGLHCTDEKVYYNPERAVHNNSSMEVYVSANDNNSISANTVQLRIDAQNHVDTWIGRDADFGDGYNWSPAVVKFMSRAICHGEINSGEAEGYTIEIFLPYDQIGLEKKPQAIYVLPAFNRVRSASGMARLSWNAPGGNINDPGTYYKYDATGYHGGDKADVPVGDYNDTYKTGGWEMDHSGKMPIAKTVASGEQRAYYKGIYSTKYFFETTVKNDEGVDAAGAPKMGIIIGQNAKGTAISMLDVAQSYTLDWFAWRRPAGEDWNWGSPKQRYNGSMGYAGGVKLGVLRNGDEFYYFINGAFILKETVTMFGGEPTMVGLITFGTKATYFNFAGTQDGAEVDAVLAKIDNTDSENDWKWLGNYEVASENKIVVGSSVRSENKKIAGVGGAVGGSMRDFDERYIDKQGVTLTGDFELSFTVSDLEHSSMIPNWMDPDFVLLLRRKSGDADRIKLYVGTRQDDYSMSGSGHVQIAGNGKIPVGGIDLSSYKSSRGVTVTVKREIVNTKSVFTVTLTDGVNTKTVSAETEYADDYTFGFNSDYTAATVSNITWNG